jgi:hypothetical protein
MVMQQLGPGSGGGVTGLNISLAEVESLLQAGTINPLEAMQLALQALGPQGGIGVIFDDIAERDIFLRDFLGVPDLSNLPTAYAARPNLGDIVTAATQPAADPLPPTAITPTGMQTLPMPIPGFAPGPPAPVPIPTAPITAPGVGPFQVPLPAGPQPFAEDPLLAEERRAEAEAAFPTGTIDIGGGEPDLPPLEYGFPQTFGDPVTDLEARQRALEAQEDFAPRGVFQRFLQGLTGFAGATPYAVAGAEAQFDPLHQQFLIGQPFAPLDSPEERTFMSFLQGGPRGAPRARAEALKQQLRQIQSVMKAGPLGAKAFPGLREGAYEQIRGSFDDPGDQFAAAITPLGMQMAPSARRAFEAGAKRAFAAFTAANPEKQFLDFARQRGYF